jgi:hypothetical protein
MDCLSSSNILIYTNATVVLFRKIVVNEKGTFDCELTAKKITTIHRENLIPIFYRTQVLVSKVK